MGVQSSGCQPGRAGPRDQDLATIREAFPRWEIWYVPLALGNGTTWCARRLPLLASGTARALAQALADVEGGDAASLVLSADDVPISGPARLPLLDRLRAELAAVFPGWHIVYRPIRDGRVEWEAYRLPLLHAHNTAELAEYMYGAIVPCNPQDARRPVPEA